LPDFREGSQDITADQTRKHAMAGIINDNGKIRYQTREEAIKANKEYVKEMIEKGGLDNLGNALHAVQDRYAKGHNFKPWKGFHLNLETVLHLYDDIKPSSLSLLKAFFKSRQVLKKYKKLHKKIKKPKRKDK